MTNLAKIPKIACQLHPRHHYTEFCLSEECIRKVLCPECLKEHNSNHRILSFKEIFLLERARLEKILENESSIEENEKNTFETISSKITELWNRIEAVMHGLKQKIKNICDKYSTASRVYHNLIRQFLANLEKFQPKNLDSTHLEEDLFLTLNLYTRISSTKNISEFSPIKSFDKFLKELQKKVEEFTNLTYVLNEAYVYQSSGLDNLKLINTYAAEASRKAVPRACDTINNTFAIAYEKIYYMKSPVFLGKVEGNQIVGALHELNHTTIVNQVKFLNENLFASSSSTSLKLFKFKDLQIKPLGTLNITRISDLKVSPMENLVFAAGMNPHCSVIRVIGRQAKVLNRFSSFEDQGSSCLLLEYLPSRSVMALCFLKKILLISLIGKKILQRIDISQEIRLLKHLTIKDQILTVFKDNEIKVWEYTGLGRYELKSRASIISGNVVGQAIVSSCVFNKNQNQVLFSTNQKVSQILDLERCRVLQSSWEMYLNTNNVLYLENLNKICFSTNENVLYLLDVL